MANPEIANLWSEYQLILDEFKEAHKGHSESRKESNQFKELKNDIGIIDTEKENGKSNLVTVAMLFFTYKLSLLLSNEIV